MDPYTRGSTEAQESGRMAQLSLEGLESEANRWGEGE